MADAIPVNDAPKGKKSPVPQGMKEAVKAQAPAVVAESDFKTKGGAPLGNHQAVREDF